MAELIVALFTGITIGILLQAWRTARCTKTPLRDVLIQGGGPKPTNPV